MHWNSVLAAVLGLVANVCAQGSLGGSQASCSTTTQAWNYLGCYSNTENGRHLGFNWQLSATAGSAQSYPGFTGSTNMTVEICLEACRGHGFRYAALYTTSECYCSAGFPAFQTVSSTSQGPGSYLGTQPGAATQDSTTNNSTINTCHVQGSPCTGNANEYCGSTVASDLYEDPSFTTASTAGAPSNYGYFGCYSNISPGPLYLSVETTSSVACQTYCGELGYAFMARSYIDSATTQNTCLCGTEIQAGLELPESSCSYYCNGAGGAV